MAELSPAVCGGPTACGGSRPFRPLLHGFVATLLALQVGCVSFTGEDPTLRTPGGWLDDEVIERMASRRIDAADERLAISHVNVVSYDGIVLLTGQVADQGLRSLAEDSIREIRKVRKIHNEIQIGGANSLVARGNDNWLQTKVKAQLLADEDVEGSRIKVFVEDGIVYLIGVLPREQADAAVAVARTVFGIQRVVKVFDYVENSS
ncbi:MAG: BON domain-containing protein [Gammaproteobacteria bacterium]|nr:BON domain-containing protein [Gammaproteobacteria bacterium]